MLEDPTEQVAELRDALDRQTERFERARGEIGPLTAADSSGAVTVTVDAEGVLRSVAVAADWQRHLQPEALGGGVQDAMAAAAASRAQRWATTYAQDEPPPALRPMPTPGQSLAGRLTELTEQAAPAGDEHVLGALLEMVRELNDSIDQVSADVQRALGAQFTGRSSSGHVTAVVTGAGAVAAMGCDDSWVRRAHHSNVGREMTEAIRDAYRQAADRRPAQIIEDSPLGQIQRLAGDPTALADRLRLRG